MPNQFAALPVPADDGVGAWVDTSAMAPEKTVTVDGGAYAGALIIESSNDAQTSGCALAGLPVFTGGTAAPVDVFAATQWMRVRRSGTFGGPGAPTVTIGAPPATASVFGAMAVPAGDGVGAGIDLSAGGDANTFNVVGPFSGRLAIEVSTDAGATWSPAAVLGLSGTTTPGSTSLNIVGVIASARVRRVGTVPGQPAPVVSAGSGSAASSSAFPGYYDLTPAAVDSATPGPGVSLLLARGDHIHGLDPAAGGWFAERLAAAKAAVPAAGFDTVIPAEFAETITSQLVAIVGVADADPSTLYNGGVVSVAVGDAVISPSSARLELVGSPSHVGDLAGKSWYAASLVRLDRPVNAQIGDTFCDMIALWADDDNTVGLGVLGDGSGGSATKWVGHVTNAASVATTLGPNLDPEGAALWHLFECWFDVDTGLTHFRIDGVAFAGTIAAAPPSMPAALGLISRRDAVGDQSVANYDKLCVVVASPRVGGSD